MAETRTLNLETGLTLKVMLENAAGQVWNGTSFVTFALADIATYLFSRAESPASSGRYPYTIPAGAATALGGGTLIIKTFESGDTWPDDYQQRAEWTVLIDASGVEVEANTTTPPTTAEIKTAMEAAGSTLASIDGKIPYQFIMDSLDLATGYVRAIGSDGNYLAKGDDLTNLVATIGTPAGASLAADIAAIDAGGDTNAGTLALIKAQTDKISTRALQVNSPQLEGNLVLFQGDSYSVTPGTVSDTTFLKPSGATWPTDLTDWTITFTANKTEQNSNAGDDAIQVTGTVVTATGASQSVRVELAKTDTATLAPSESISGSGYDFSIIATNGDETKTLLVGTMNVVKALNAPA